MDDTSYGSAYGSVAQYFSKSGGTNSPGKAGGAGYNNDLTTGGGSTQGDTQQASAQSGSGWISAAASTDSTDKSNFATPFQQGFGGIANYNIVGSPGVGISGATPINAPPTVSAVPVLGGGSINVGTVLLIVAVVLAMKFLKG